MLLRLRHGIHILNANGVYVTAYPFNLNVIESTVQEAGKVLTYVKGLYDGYLAGGINVQKFKETLLRWSVTKRSIKVSNACLHMNPV